MRIWQSAFAGLGVFAAGLLALGWAMPLFRLPKPTGAFPVGTRTLYLTDPVRNRELVVQLWYPAQPMGKPALYTRPNELRPLYRYQSLVRTNSFQDAPVAAGEQTFPVLVVGVMWGGRRTQDTFLVEELASHGYVVVAVDHPGNAARVEMQDGRVVRATMAGALDLVPGRTAEEILNAWNAELNVWTADNRFVLDELERRNTGGWAAGRLDLRHVGAVGHSFGGAASLALLGADARVKCAINMDGWTFAGLDQRRDQSMMLLYEEADATGGPTEGVEGQLDAADQAVINASLQRYGGYRAYIQGTQHADFTDATLMSPIRRLTTTGPIEGERIRTILRGLVLGFFNQELKGQGSIPTYPEVVVTANKPPQK